MVIVRLYGGLGNQLFQYAAGRAIAQRRRAAVGVDIADFARDPRRSYRLHHLRTVAVIVPRRVACSLTDWRWRGVARSLPFLIRHGQVPVRHQVLAEKHFNFDPGLLEAGPDVYLDGYWQSASYFADIRPLLLQEFTVRNAAGPQNAALAQLIAETESVSVHVRRGDYVTDPRTHAYHGVCSPAFYQAAVAEMARRLARPHFFIFSDDPAWARQNLVFSHPVTYVDVNGPDQEYEDLRLMSGCKHHIVANSSFSWWGAWLSRCEEKTVIAPARWFDAAQLDTRDLVPASWQRM